MQTEVLRVLRTEAQSWWRHRELRRTGDLDEACRLERQTILRDLGYLRTAINNPNAYVSCGGGGTILHLGLTTVSLYAPVERFPLASLAVRLGTPLIDCRPVRDIITLANLPRVTMDGQIDLVLSRFSSGLFRAMFAMKEMSVVSVFGTNGSLI